MIVDQNKSVLDQTWFTLKQVGVYSLALLAFTVPWTWRVATTHHEFLLLKETTAIEKKYQYEQNRLINLNHLKDMEILSLKQEDLDKDFNRRLDNKTKRNSDKINEIKHD